MKSFSKKNIYITIIIISIFLLTSSILTFLKFQKKYVIFNGIKYENQNIQIPKDYIGNKISTYNDFEIYEIKNYNKSYHIAIQRDNKYLFYKTKESNGINFTN